MFHLLLPSQAFALSLSQTWVRNTLQLFWQGSGFMSSRNYSRAFWGFLELTVKLKNAGVNYRTPCTNYRHPFAPMSGYIRWIPAKESLFGSSSCFEFFRSMLLLLGLFLENFHCNVKFSTNLFFFFVLTWLLKVPELGIWQFRSSLVIWRALYTRVSFLHVVCHFIIIITTTNYFSKTSSIYHVARFFLGEFIFIVSTWNIFFLHILTFFVKRNGPNRQI